MHPVFAFDRVLAGLADFRVGPDRGEDGGRIETAADGLTVPVEGAAEILNGFLKVGVLLSDGVAVGLVVDAHQHLLDRLAVAHFGEAFGVIAQRQAVLIDRFFTPGQLRNHRPLLPALGWKPIFDNRDFRRGNDGGCGGFDGFGGLFKGQSLCRSNSLIFTRIGGGWQGWPRHFATGQNQRCHD